MKTYTNYEAMLEDHFRHKQEVFYYETTHHNDSFCNLGTRTKSIVYAGNNPFQKLYVTSIFSCLYGVKDDPSIHRVIYQLNNTYYLEATKVVFDQVTYWSFSDTPLSVVPFTPIDVYIEGDLTKPHVLGGLVVLSKDPVVSQSGTVLSKVWIADWINLDEDPERKYVRRNDIICDYTSWVHDDGAIILG